MRVEQQRRLDRGWTTPCRDDGYVEINSIDGTFLARFGEWLGKRIRFLCVSWRNSDGATLGLTLVEAHMDRVSYEGGIFILEVEESGGKAVAKGTATLPIGAIFASKASFVV